MPSSPSSDLLQPSLVDTQPRQAPYSLQTAFLVSFFGGPLAAATIFGINARRIGRLRLDMVGVVAVALAYIAFEWWWRHTSGGQAFDAWLIASSASPAADTSSACAGSWSLRSAPRSTGASTRRAT